MDENHDIESKLYQILHATHYFTFNGIKYKSVANTIEDKYLANLIYNEILEEVKYENIMSWEQAKFVSERLGIWTSQNEEGLKGMEKMLENLKLDLYKSHINPDKVKTLRKQIKNIKSGIQKSNNNKHTLYHCTKEYYALNIKRQFLIALSIRDMNNNRLFTIDNFWDSDDSLINAATEIMNTNYIPHEDIRKIARSEPWRSMWIINKGNTFSTASTEWTDEQRILASYSKMYDNVYESMDCPPDNIINDDDMLDGWFIDQRREKEKKQKESSIDKVVGNKKGKDGQELFIMANSHDQAKEIYNMNDEATKAIIRSREQTIKAKGEVDHGDLPDVQNELRMQATRQFQSMMRKR